MLKRFSTNHAILCIFLDAVFTALSLRLAFVLRPMMSGLNVMIKDIQTPKEIGIYAYVLLPIMWVLVFMARDQYNPEKNLRVVDEVSGVFLSSIIAAIVLAGTLYLSDREISRVLFLTFVALATAFALLHRIIYRIYYKLAKNPQVEEKRVLIAGKGPVGKKLEDQINGYASLGYKVVGFVDDNVSLQQKDPTVLGTIEQIGEIIQQYRVNDVLVALPRRAYARLDFLVKTVHALPVRLWVIPDYFHLALSEAKMLDFAGTPMIDLRAPALNHYQRLTKRLFDLAFSVPLLILLSPIFAIIA
jgi:FlaA1/EpsC-like NDP-sugar epimerase